MESWILETVSAVDGRKMKHAVCTQNMFRRTMRNAEQIGMKANTKNALLCISDALSFKAGAFFRAEDGMVLSSSEGLKLLGFCFNSRPNCDAHVEAMKKSFRGRYWMLIHMRQHHFTEEELVQAYKVIVRPIAEYCLVVYHSMITDQQDEAIERLQSAALLYIYGYGLPYANMREKSGIQTLRSRRIEACDKFATTCAASTRFNHWFPETKSTRRSRHALPYVEEFVRWDRLRNSPIYYMRRRLNGKQGKTYGRRNKQYRE